MKKSLVAKILLLAVLVMSFSIITAYADESMQDSVSTIKSSGEDEEEVVDSEAPVETDSEMEMPTTDSEEYEDSEE